MYIEFNLIYIFTKLVVLKYERGVLSTNNNWKVVTISYFMLGKW